MTKNLPKGISERGGKFRVSIMVDGKRKTGTCDTLAEAVTLAENIRAGLVEETLVGARWTLREGMDHYIAERLLPGGYAESTITQYESRMRVLTEYLGETTVMDDLTSADAYQFVASAREERGVKPDTLKNDCILLTAIMRHARKMGGMVADLPEMPEIRRPTPKVRYLSYEEEKAILDYFEHVGDDFMVDLVQVLVDTGMRIAVECLCLPRDGVDLKNHKVTIVDSKGEAVPRTIPLTDRAHKILKRRLLGAPLGQGPFAGVRYPAVGRRWKAMRKHMGWEDSRKYTLHICRHTYCTRLASGGVDLKTVQVLAGHNNIQTTMKYAHFVPKNMFKAIDALALPESKKVSHIKAV